jgi:hypothetical protein
MGWIILITIVTIPLEDYTHQHQYREKYVLLYVVGKAPFVLQK